MAEIISFEEYKNKIESDDGYTLEEALQEMKEMDEECEKDHGPEIIDELDWEFIRCRRKRDKLDTWDMVCLLREMLEKEKYGKD